MKEHEVQAPTSRGKEWAAPARTLMAEAIGDRDAEISGAFGVVRGQLFGVPDIYECQPPRRSASPIASVRSSGVVLDRDFGSDLGPRPSKERLTRPAAYPKTLYPSGTTDQGTSQVDRITILSRGREGS